ncbi:MAG: hypothetical protein WC477_05090 [Patescibacteria group bacterium]
MGVQKIIFDGANVTSKIDADLHHFLFSNDVGILKGLRHECAFSLANNTITLLEGYVSIYGRVVYIENQTAVVVTPDSVKFGYVVLNVDTSANTAQLYVKEEAGTYPTLIQTDLQTIDGVYELALCAYSKTTTSVTLVTDFQRMFILSDRTRVEELESSLTERHLPVRLILTKVSNGVYRFSGYNSVAISESILYLTIEYSTVLVFPGQLLFLVVGSNTSIGYRRAGSDYTLGISYSSDTVTLTCGSTEHRITSAFIKK